MKTCVVCGKELSGRQTRHCSIECRARYRYLHKDKDKRVKKVVEDNCSTCKLFEPQRNHETGKPLYTEDGNCRIDYEIVNCSCTCRFNPSKYDKRVIKKHSRKNTTIAGISMRSWR